MNNQGVLNLNMLPQDFVAIILSLTSPSDACRSTLVSSTLRSAAKSDVFWEKFSPSDYQDLVSRSITSLKFSSKKDLYLRLCNPTLIDNGRKVLQSCSHYLILFCRNSQSLKSRPTINSSLVGGLNSFIIYCIF